MFSADITQAAML